MIHGGYEDFILPGLCSPFGQGAQDFNKHQHGGNEVSKTLPGIRSCAEINLAMRCYLLGRKAEDRYTSSVVSQGGWPERGYA